MDVPRTLAARLYLLAYDPAKGRLVGGELGYVLRAAALTDLLHRGHLVDRDGKAEVNARLPAPADPVLSMVLDEVASARPRSWQHWVGRRIGPVRAAVAGELAAQGWIELRPHRVLGVLPTTRVVLLRPGVIGKLGDRVRAALRAETGELDPADAALVALAAAGELKTALPRPLRHERRARIAELERSTGPVAQALRKALAQHRAAASGA
jgi:Golgi phosphoprotein 3 (GPP34)